MLVALCWDLPALLVSSCCDSSLLAVKSNGNRYRMFRITQTGVNSNNHYYLSCSGLELYGNLFNSVPAPFADVVRACSRACVAACLPCWAGWLAWLVGWLGGWLGWLAWLVGWVGGCGFPRVALIFLLAGA